ncbi:MAG: CYTH domain-containing protein [Geminocystis sp.]|nr:CYTH domain-containing protein [Geminocystis sp.]HIK36592.1 CYTH domain-containing protein [Geminocystis sp. M7585_C2015_104]MCS7147952.1 CYTH domain-containing protein [Geminocystis sp.]MCX8078779.1 CYTH domain-containing protein [Geminocystis sp.]MDW8116852.1 CYTH domain-containing protein [Geminocystis sp.]
MAKEIERKFLVKKEQWQPPSGGVLYRQGYINTNTETTVRVRLVGNQGFLTIKGKTIGNTRLEYEYPIPFKDAQEMLDFLCVPPLIEKKRYKVEENGLLWEVDVFLGENEGLILAEVELEDESQEIILPQWVGEEVTDDPRYYNVNLVKNPFRKWKV